MVELAIRILIAGAAVVVSGLAGPNALDAGWKTALVFAAYSFLVQRLEARGLRNSGMAGFVAAADAICVAIVLGAAGRLEQFGFLVLAPCAYAAAAFGSLPTAMAPIAAASLVASYAFFTRNPNPGPAFYGQLAGVLALGLLLNHRRIIVTVDRPVVVEEPTKEDAPEPDAFMELRESFRKLRDAYRSLEGRSRRDRLAVEMFEVRHGEDGRFFDRLAVRLRELTGSDSLILYTLAQVSDSMVVRAYAGEPPAAIRDFSITVELASAPALIRESTEEALAALTSEEDRAHLANVLLRHSGRIVGLLCLVMDDPARLDKVRQSAEELTVFASASIAEETEIRASRVRTRRAELLYDVASVTSGAETPNSLAARVVRELREVVEADHLAVSWLDGEETVLAAASGEPMRFLDCISFSKGPGLAGWLKVGAPELAMFDTAEDIRCTPKEAIKRRVRSFIALPIQFGESAYGILTAASHAAGGLDATDLESLRLVTGELCQALARITEGEARPSGFATPGEFQSAVVKTSEGWLVHLEALRRQQMVENFGKAVFDQALRGFARRVRSRLPVGGLLTQREDGDLVALLPAFEEESARSWANEAAATASFIGVPIGDSDKRVPLAFRAKVAPLSASLESESPAAA